MNSPEWPPLIGDVRAEETGGKLILQFLNPTPVGVAKEKADHTIGEDTIDERIDDASQASFAAYFLK